jgi:hypothetical protein
MPRRASKRVAVIAGLALSLASAGSAMALFGLDDLNLDISPSVTPSVTPVVVAPSVEHSFSIVDSFLLNSHNDASSDFIDMNDVGNIRANNLLVYLTGLL